MPLGTEMYLWVPKEIPNEEYNSLTHKLTQYCVTSGVDIHSGGILIKLADEDKWKEDIGVHITRQNRTYGTVYQVNFCMSFYSSEYRRGDVDFLTKIADLIEESIPSAELWYGPDDGSDFFICFSPEFRLKLRRDSEEYIRDLKSKRKRE